MIEVTIIKVHSAGKEGYRAVEYKISGTSPAVKPDKTEMAILETHETEFYSKHTVHMAVPGIPASDKWVKTDRDAVQWLLDHGVIDLAEEMVQSFALGKAGLLDPDWEADAKVVIP